MKGVSFARGGDTSAEPSVSPLIDMVFMLLVFFVVTTCFVDEQGLTLSPATTGAPRSDPEPLVIRADAEYRIYCGEAEISLDDLANHLSATRWTDELTARLEVAPSLSASFMVAIADSCAAAGIRNLSVISAEQRPKVSMFNSQLLPLRKGAPTC